MKAAKLLAGIILSFWLITHCAFGQGSNSADNPRTILWKITGKDCTRASYLLGTMHLADAEWLYEYDEFKKVIDSTDFILTEAFTTDSLRSPSVPYADQLKALPLLSEKQYHTLDSFFVARVGEGIRNNPDAVAMTVPELEGAIVSTLIAGSQGANGITSLMDLDLFKHYQKSGKKGDRLDRVAPTEFDSTHLDQARQYLARSLKYIEGSDKPDWNIYHQNDIGDVVSRYKKMQFDYKLNENASQVATSSDYDFVPVEARNRNWMKKITETISVKPTLIAVGLGHLYYRTGVIMLLRERGYQVEPLMLHKR